MATRITAFDYGSITIGGASTVYLLDSAISHERDYAEGILTASCTVMIYSTTRANFLQAEEDLLAEFRKPYQDLKLTLVTQEYEYKTSDNSGFNHRPSIRHMPNEAESEVMKWYTVEVVVELPADHAGDNGLHTLFVNLTENTNGNLSAAVSGSYTALASNDATAQKDAQLNTLLTALLSDLNANVVWELVALETTRDKEDKRISFSASYRNAEDRESTDGTYVAAIKNSSTVVTTSRDSTAPLPVEAGETQRPSMVKIDYSCQFDRNQLFNNGDTFPVKYGKIRAIWEDTIRQNLLSQMNVFLVAINAAVTEPEIRVASLTITPATPALAASLEVVFHGEQYIAGMIEYERTHTPPLQILRIVSDRPGNGVLVPKTPDAMITGRGTLVGINTTGEAVRKALIALISLPTSYVIGDPNGQELVYQTRTLPQPHPPANWKVTLSHYVDDVARDKISSVKSGDEQLGVGVATTVSSAEYSKTRKYFTDDSRDSSGGGGGEGTTTFQTIDPGA